MYDDGELFSHNQTDNTSIMNTLRKQKIVSMSNIAHVLFWAETHSKLCVAAFRNNCFQHKRQVNSVEWIFTSGFDWFFGNVIR